MLFVKDWKRPEQESETVEKIRRGKSTFDGNVISHRLGWVRRSVSEVRDEGLESSKHQGHISVIILRSPSTSCRRSIHKVRTYRNNQRTGPWAQLLVRIQVPIRCDTLDLAQESRGMRGSGMQLQLIQNGLGLPFEFTRLTGSSGHVLQLENSPEDLGDDLGHQLRTQGPGQNITMDVMLLGARMIDRCGFRKRTLLDNRKNYCQRQKTRELTFMFALAMLA
jgi:hypothetical protein